VRYFVFVEFGNSEVTEFLARLREALTQNKVNAPIHVTLRGPYSKPPPLDQVEEFAERLRGFGVKIHGNGYFNTPAGFAVFLRAECSVFRELWDKPDFKVSPALIQPHITVYESPNRLAAQRVRDFLKQEQIHIHTYDLFLSIYGSKVKQQDLFGMPAVSSPGKKISRDLWRIPEGVLERAKELGNELAVLADSSNASFAPSPRSIVGMHEDSKLTRSEEVDED
jgi:hypothetical protein